MENPEKYSDEFLIEKILSTGDTKYFGIIYDKYANKVFRKCFTITQNEKDAEDICQNVMMKAFLNLAKFRGEASFSTYLYRITYNSCIDFVKSKQKKFEKINQELKPEQNEVLDDSNIELEILNDLKLSNLRKAIEQLDENERLLIMMKYYDKLSITDISKKLNRSQSAVKMRLMRIRKKLKNIINGDQITLILICYLILNVESKDKPLNETILNWSQKNLK